MTAQTLLKERGNCLTKSRRAAASRWTICEAVHSRPYWQEGGVGSGRTQFDPQRSADVGAKWRSPSRARRSPSASGPWLMSGAYRSRSSEAQHLSNSRVSSATTARGSRVWRSCPARGSGLRGFSELGEKQNPGHCSVHTTHAVRMHTTHAYRMHYASIYACVVAETCPSQGTMTPLPVSRVLAGFLEAERLIGL